MDRWLKTQTIERNLNNENVTTTNSYTQQLLQEAESYSLFIMKCVL